MQKLLTFICLGCFFSSLIAQTYQVDPAFADSGYVYQDLANGTEKPAKILIRPDGKIVVCGSNYDITANDHHLFIAQYLADGSPDYSFADSGLLYTNFNFRSIVNDAYLQDDGKIVLSGVDASTNGVSQIKPALFRIMPDGTTDTTFGNAGVATYRFTDDSSGEFFRVEIQSDDKIVGFGSSYAAGGSGTSGLGVMRFLKDGSLDSTFNGTGKNRIAQTLAFYIGDGRIQHANKYVVAAPVVPAGNQTVMGLVRFLENGLPDPNFHQNGLLLSSINLAKYTANLKMEVLDSMIYVTGEVTDSSNRQALGLARFLYDGSLDLSFGDNGLQIFSEPGTDLYINQMRKMDNGKLLLIGRSSTEFYALAVNPSGDVDTSFANQGKLRYAYFPNSSHLGYDLVVLADQSLLSCSSLSNKILLARHINTLNTSFGPDLSASLAIKVFPIPSRERLNLQWESSPREITQIAIYDLQGRLVLQQSVPAGSSQQSLDLKTIAKGQYVLRVRQSSKASSRMILLQD
ncbi:MAG: T9SS type A sorting domain-containing protein [Bacteroidia bacterium]